MQPLTITPSINPSLTPFHCSFSSLVHREDGSSLNLPGYMQGYVKLDKDPDCSLPVCSL